VLGKLPLIAGASTTICARFISRAAPLCTNLDGNLCPTLTAHSEPLPFSELAETGSRQIIHISIRVLGWTYFASVAAKRCDFLRLINMLLKATFPSSYLGLVEATSAAKKKWVLFGTACYKFMSVKNTPLPQQCIIYSTPFRRTVHAYSLSKRCDHASQKQAQTAKCLANPL